MLNISFSFLLLLVPLQVHNTTAFTVGDFIQWVIIGGGLIWNLLIASNRKLEAATETRIQKIEKAIEELQKDGLTDGDLIRLKEDVRDHDNAIEAIKEDRERRSREWELRDRQIDKQFNEFEKNNIRELASIRNILEKIGK